MNATQETILSVDRMNRSAIYLADIGETRGAAFLETAIRVCSSGRPLEGRDRDTVVSLMERARRGYQGLPEDLRVLAAVDPT